MFFLALAIFSWTALAGMLLRHRFGSWQTLTLLPYQSGILFRRGVRSGEVQGKVKVRVPFEKVIILDKRLAPISIEGMLVTLRDGGIAVYGFSGMAELKDTGKAMYSARNYNDVPVYLLICCARTVLNGCTTSRVRTGGDGIAREIAALASPKFEDSGFGLTSFRFTRSWASTPRRDRRRRYFPV
jgi:hypothetical protein